MKTKFLKIILIVFSLGMFFFSLNAYAQTTSGTAASDPYGLKETGNAAFGEKVVQEQGKVGSIYTVIGKIINYGLTFLGVIFMLLILYAGLLWMISFGDQTKVTKAKDILFNSTIGLAIVFLAYAISYFVVETILKAVK